MSMNAVASIFQGDVKLAGDFCDQEWASRLSLSSGVLQVLDAHKGIRYAHNAFVPRDDWRALHDDELAWLTRGVVPNIDRTGTVYLDRFVMPDFSELRDVAKRYGVAAARRFTESPAMRQAVSDARARADDLFVNAAPLRALGISVSEPGLCTSSMEMPPVRKYVGLHIDQWSDDETVTKSTASRLSINIGNEARYFLAINMTLPAMRQLLGQQDGDGRLVALRFLSKFADFPVLRIKIEPGEGYLAMARNLIHDATSTDMQGIDLSLSFLGEFLNDSPWHERRERALQS